MAEFDPERFETEKYREYFPELQQAYKNAFDRMKDEYDSTLVHAVDQAVLSESEPFYEDGNGDDGRFRIDLPEEPTPADRVRNAGVVTDEERLEAMLAEYRETLDEELRRVLNVRGDAGGEGNA